MANGACTQSFPRKIHVKHAQKHIEGARAMTEYLIAAVLFVAMLTALVYLWKRERS